MLKKGSLLHTEKPFVHVLSPDLRNVRCDFCFAEERPLFLLNREITVDCEEYVWVKKIYELFKCGGCHYVKYCDKVCQKLAWPDHKLECFPLKRVLQSGRQLPNSARVLARIILKIKRGAGGQQGWYDKNKFRMFKDLMSHYTELKNDEKRVEHAQCLYEVLKDFIGSDNLPIFTEFLGIYGRMVVNSFNILDGEMFELGTGVYLGASTIDHSCDPNAVATFNGTTISIRAIKDIKDYSWSKVRIAYTETMRLAADRNKDLSPKYYFDCDCPRCDPKNDMYLIEDSMLCLKCSSPVFMSLPDASCSNCRWKPPIDVIAKYNDIVSFTRHHHDIMRNVAYLDASKMCLEKQNGLFHPDNVYVAKTLELAFEASIQLQKWDDSLELGPKLVPLYKLYYGPCHPVLGLFYMKFGKILLLKDDYEQAMESLEKAQEILRDTHGENHPLCKSQLASLLLQAKSLLYHQGDGVKGGL